MKLIQASAMLCACLLLEAKAARLKGRQSSQLAHPLAEDEEQIKNAVSEGFEGQKGAERMPPFNADSTDAVDETYSHGVRDKHIEPVTEGDEITEAPESISTSLGASIEKIEQQKQDEEAETPAGNEVSDSYNPTNEEISANEAAAEAISVPEDLPEPKPRQETPQAKTVDFKQKDSVVNSRFAQLDDDHNEEEEETREEQLDEAEEELKEKEEEDEAEISEAPEKKPSPMAVKKILLEHGESLERIISSIISSNTGIADVLGTNKRLGKVGI